jgi:hypothetical protein
LNGLPRWQHAGGVILPIDGGLSTSNGQPSFVALAAG